MKLNKTIYEFICDGCEKVERTEDYKGPETWLTFDVDGGDSADLKTWMNSRVIHLEDGLTFCCSQCFINYCIAEVKKFEAKGETNG